MENENLEPATDDVVSILIQDLQSDFDQDTPQEQPQTDSQEAQPTEQQTEQHAEPEKTTSRTEQLLEKARREREYRQREADLETKIETAVAGKLEELKVSAQRDSLGTLAQLGIESEDQLKQLAYEIVYKLEGQGAPPEYKAQQSLSEVQRLRKEMEDMQRSMRETYEQQMQQMQAQQQAEKYVGQFTSHVVSNPDQTPHLSNYYKTDPEAAVRLFCETASQAMAGGAAQPKAEDVAAYLDAEIAKEAERWSKIKGSQTQQQTARKPASTKDLPPSLSSQNPSGSGNLSKDSDEFDYIRDVENLLKTEFRK